MGYYLNIVRIVGITKTEDIVNNSFSDKCTCSIALITFKFGIYFTQIFPLNIIPSASRHHHGYILKMTVVAIKDRISTSRSFMH